MWTFVVRQVEFVQRVVRFGLVGETGTSPSLAKRLVRGIDRFFFTHVLLACMSCRYPIEYFLIDIRQRWE
jgi:hypothetical protein